LAAAAERVVMGASHREEKEEKKGRKRGIRKESLHAKEEDNESRERRARNEGRDDISEMVEVFEQY
jgi:hypothetical protein